MAARNQPKIELTKDVDWFLLATPNDEFLAINTSAHDAFLVATDEEADIKVEDDALPIKPGQVISNETPTLSDAFIYVKGDGSFIKYMKKGI